MPLGWIPIIFSGQWQFPKDWSLHPKNYNFEWKNPHWNSSLGLALEIKKNFAIISHLGVGSYEKKVYPFITLTIGSFYY